MKCTNIFFLCDSSNWSPNIFLRFLKAIDFEKNVGGIKKTDGIPEKVCMNENRFYCIDCFGASIRELSGLRNTAVGTAQSSRISLRPKRRPKTPTKGDVVVEYRESSQNDQTI